MLQLQRNLLIKTMSKSINMHLVRTISNSVQMEEQDMMDDEYRDGQFNQLYDQLDGYNPTKHDIILMDCDFDANINPNIERLGQLGFNRKQISKMFKKSPSSFSNLKLGRNQQIEQGIRVLEQSIDALQLVEDSQQKVEFIKRLVYINPKSMQMSRQQWEATVKALRVDLEMSNQQIMDLVNRYPRIMNEQLVYQVKQLSKLIKLYLDIDNTQFNELFIKFPYILMVPETQVMENIKQLLNWGFGQQQIYEILLDNSQVLTYRQTAIQVIKHTLMDQFKLKPRNFRNVVLENKQLLVMCAQNLLKPKYEMFESFGIDEYMQNYMMKTCPRVYVKSTNSIFNKLTYLQKRWNVKDLQNYSELVYYLNFNYVLQIRPRGEAMIKTKQIRSWIDVLELTDAQFCKEVGMDQTEFNKIKNQLHPNSEQDHRKRFYSDLIKPEPWSQY